MKGIKIVRVGNVMLYKIKGKNAVQISQKSFSEENKVEGNLEDWVENNPSILGENLLIMGRQVQIAEVNDSIDLLALDTNGNTVIIELKRGRIKDPVDIQSLRYASYISRWDYKRLENQATSYFSEKFKSEFNFNEKIEGFFSSSGLDTTPDLNQDQRIIIAGNKLTEKLGSVAIWLREHNVDIKIVEIGLFPDGDNLLLSPQIVIPVPSSEKFEIGKHSISKDRPWLIDGKEWHLSKKCEKITKDKLISFVELIEEKFANISEPSWNQKDYISFKDSEKIHMWISVKTLPSTLIFNIFVKKQEFNVEDVANSLDIKIFNRDFSMSEKLQLDSSVEITNKGEYDRIRLRAKESFDIKQTEFLEFLKKCYNSFKQV
jgi:hypothetical protein